MNAYDEFAYTYLGLAYEREQKYDDAVQQFQKQIEIGGDLLELERGKGDCRLLAG